jgi:hypothetical protein
MSAAWIKTQGMHPDSSFKEVSNRGKAVKFYTGEGDAKVEHTVMLTNAQKASQAELKATLKKKRREFLGLTEWQRGMGGTTADLGNYLAEENVIPRDELSEPDRAAFGFIESSYMRRKRDNAIRRIMRKLGKKLGKPPEVWMSPEFTEEYWTRRKRPSLTANPGRADGSCVADSMMARMEHEKREREGK